MVGLEEREKRGLMADGLSRREMDVIRKICPDGVAEGGGEFTMSPGKDGRTTLVSVVIKRGVQPCELSKEWDINLAMTWRDLKSGEISHESSYLFRVSRHFTDVFMRDFKVITDGEVAAEKIRGRMTRLESIRARDDEIFYLNSDLATVAYLMEQGRSR